MSITYTESAPARAAAAVPAEDAATSEVRQPLLWLTGIVLLGLALRWWQVNAPLEMDEFGPIYAVAERTVAPGALPAAAEALRPVSSWQVVRDRSVLPYGIVNPVPVYHYLLYGLIQVLPVAEWSLRLPSLLASLGCIVGIYFLCRRLLGTETALVAALLTALDPIQIGTSDLVRPYALGNLACVLSFVSLWKLLYASRLWVLCLGALGYALAVALIGYLNPILLLVGVAHAGVVAYWLLVPTSESETPQRSGIASGLLGWLAGGALACVLLLPEVGYWQALQQFSRQHYDYLGSVTVGPLTTLLLHNSTFLTLLIVISVATFVAREMNREEEAEEGAAPEPGASASDSAEVPQAEDALARSSVSAGAEATAALEPPPPANMALIWLARFWLFFPQIVVLMMAYSSHQALFLTRYLSYTTLGGMILVAYWATRDRSRNLRLGISATAAATMLLWGFMAVSRGYGLNTYCQAQLIVKDLDRLEEEARWKPGDVVLLRGGFMEADFVPDGIPPENRATVHEVLKAPLTSLYANQTPKPIIPLSLSLARGEQSSTHMGKYYDASKFYDERLAAEIGKYERFWIATPAAWDRREFMACFLPWLADSLGWDLKVARARPEPERYFDVYTDSGPEDFIPGLSDSRLTDFSHLVLIRRKQPKGIFTLGALGAAPLPNGYLTVPLWFASEQRTPRLTNNPEELVLDELWEIDADADAVSK